MSYLNQIADGKQLECSLGTEKLGILAHVASVTGRRQGGQTSNWIEDFKPGQLEKKLWFPVLESQARYIVWWGAVKRGFVFTS